MQIENLFDTVEKVEGAVLHHGTAHNRVYLMEAERKGNWTSIIAKMNSLAEKNRYNKIVSRVPEDAKQIFQSNGYVVEAKIPGLYNGERTGYFLADYLEKGRGFYTEQELKTRESVKTIALAANGSPEDAYFKLPSTLKVRKLDKNDFVAMVSLHEKAFKSYPFPINKAAYLLELVERNHEFYGLFKEEELLVSAILKMNKKDSNVEIVDFATHPDYKGQNLSYYIVQKIKRNIDQSDYKTIYSLVRATSYGLNITYSKHGFLFGGTLLNNTVIKDNLESMNVWYSN
ncbi:MAG: putative beta-lysine N-acetyltransferase [Maribacter sp.]|jgi:putative beta-lysine N-acetyltransferase